jgi:dUTP pyrophosphatase
MNIKINIKKLEHALDILPNYATASSAGMDLMSANIEPIIIKSNEIKLVPTGICIALPNNFEAQIRPRSGLALKYGVTVLNSPGTIDSDYRGEIQVILINHSIQDFIIERGMRIAQMVIATYDQISWEEIDLLDQTSRGERGFGSTGKF